MAKRCIYFVKDKQLMCKTFDVDWNMDSPEVSKVLCRRELEESLEDFMRPCIDVSASSELYQGRSLATCYVKDSNGTSVKDTWKKLDKGSDREFLPPGCYDLLYITSLSEKQVMYALGQKSFFDMFHNPDKVDTCNAKALAVLQLLSSQGKLDYIEDMNKFLWWYWVNGQYATEWIKK